MVAKSSQGNMITELCKREEYESRLGDHDAMKNRPEPLSSGHCFEANLSVNLGENTPGRTVCKKSQPKT
jgi:hypothetical protein